MFWSWMDRVFEQIELMIQWLAHKHCICGKSHQKAYMIESEEYGKDISIIHNLDINSLHVMKKIHNH